MKWAKGTVRTKVVEVVTLTTSPSPHRGGFCLARSLSAIVVVGGAAPEGAVPAPPEAGGPGHGAAAAVGGTGISGAEGARALAPLGPLTAAA